MGAKVAMTLALRRPTAFSACIPVDNAPVDAALQSDFNIYVRGMKDIADAATAAAARGEKFAQTDADKILQQYEPDLTIRQFLLTNFVRADADRNNDNNNNNVTENKAGPPRYQFRIPLVTLAKAMPDISDFPFTDPDETRFEGPTLVVRGGKSHYVADEMLPLIGRFFPKFELLTLDSGHWVMSERFEEFRKGVVEWIRKTVDKG
jgi:pimeloyl-ACP methyl ester carboxylesterase